MDLPAPNEADDETNPESGLSRATDVQNLTLFDGRPSSGTPREQAVEPGSELRTAQSSVQVAQTSADEEFPAHASLGTQAVAVPAPAAAATNAQQVNCQQNVPQASPPAVPEEAWAYATEEESKNVFAELRCFSARDLPCRTFIYRSGATIPERAWLDLVPGQTRFIEIIIPLEFYTVFNPAFPRKQLWGRGPYTIDSDIVAALVQKGYMEPLLYYVVPPGAYPYTERVLFGRAHEHDIESMAPGMNMVEGLGISAGNERVEGATSMLWASGPDPTATVESGRKQPSASRELVARLKIRRLTPGRKVLYPSYIHNEVYSRKWIYWGDDKTEPFAEFEISRAELLVPTRTESQAPLHPMECIGYRLRIWKREELSQQTSLERKVYRFLKLSCDGLSLSSPIMSAATAAAFMHAAGDLQSPMQASLINGMDVAKRRRIAFLHDHTFRFSLSMEPCLSYGLHLICDRGSRQDLRLSSRLVTEVAYFENAEGRRFELSQGSMDATGTPLYRFMEVPNPHLLDRKQMISAGVPLPPALVRVPPELAEFGEGAEFMAWSDVAFGADHLRVKGVVLPKITGVFFITRPPHAKNRSTKTQTENPTNAVIAHERHTLNESESAESSIGHVQYEDATELASRANKVDQTSGGAPRDNDGMKRDKSLSKRSSGV
ncbi:hypothetical protein CYME_CMT277C [Cyanidioschyzon merolae strain 10D]|uniref:Uncharacterized protein n=1 Tax=Cyanidioschyzon merolae (strain NIES-3377 / 10D) TaxID=280699 RepID=M1V7N9_CYAM1|nr:hypothetical protein CYME_CMT277C [Cyanidioschyzon merolae strain 10D]BAM83250.1 hypothetical protein CYME_CMT277C [Cyanidioschyzon merolae strain 10D]|eukprot:XP_005539286.1 hypothetical protein CYME_CMT277C [Cyanidioschyzon merolae strain 10D]